MAEHDQRWTRQGSDQPEQGGSIDRLETALARIAAAAGRRQDALRAAELTARAAQHEADLLSQAEERRRVSALEQAASEAAQDAAAAESDRTERMRALIGRLDSLIETVRAEADRPSEE